MSPLPERRKSPEELAKLRAELGVPGAKGRKELPPVAAGGRKKAKGSKAGLPGLAGETESRATGEPPGGGSGPEADARVKNSLPERRKNPGKFTKLRGEPGLFGEDTGSKSVPPAMAGETESRATGELPRGEAGVSLVNSLPERRKNPGKFTKLRGEPGLSGEDKGSAGGPPAMAGETESRATEEPLSDDSGAPLAPKPVRSLKRAERAPRKQPWEPSKPAKDSKLPGYRRSEEELQRLRMKNAMSVQPPVDEVAAQAGHPLLIGLGYLLALAGGVGGVAVAAFLYFKKPRSSHHAAFITIIAILVLAFGMIYFIAKRNGA